MEAKICELVFTNRSLGVDLFDDVENYRHNDEECGAADRDGGDAGDAFQNERQDRESAWRI